MLPGVQGLWEWENPRPSPGQTSDLGSHLQRQAPAQQHCWWYEPLSAEYDNMFWGKWFRQQQQSILSSGCRGKLFPLSPLDHVCREEQQIYGKLSSVGCLYPLPLSFPDINDLCPKLSSQSITQWHQLYHSHARNASAKESWKPIPAPAHAQRNWILAWSTSMQGKKKKRKKKKSMDSSFPFVFQMHYCTQFERGGGEESVIRQLCQWQARMIKGGRVRGFADELSAQGSVHWPCCSCELLTASPINLFTKGPSFCLNNSHRAAYDQQGPWRKHVFH